MDVCNVCGAAEGLLAVISPDQISVPPPGPVPFWPILDQLQQVSLHCGQKVDAAHVIGPHQVPVNGKGKGELGYCNLLLAALIACIT
ncbi:hypothetical protein EBZ38_14520 [bacterium]|nr:hypothetical protein [bacterium]